MKRFAAALLLLASAADAAVVRNGDPKAPAAAPAATSALTLKEAFRKATNVSEDLVIQSERVEQARAQYRLTRGGILPNLRLLGSYTIQDRGDGDGNGNRDSVRRERTEARINLRQPIFQGFKEFAALSSLRHDEKREQLLLQREASLLFQDVAFAFFDVVMLETELHDLRVLMQLSGERVGEVDERRGLGKSRTSELAAAESQVANIRAEEARLIGAIAIAREELSFLTGEQIGGAPIVDDIAAPVAAPAVEELLARVLDRSDVAALREAVESRRAGIKVARAYYWPSLTANGNYYLKRTGGQEGINWDAVFSLDAPIYLGGANRAFHQQAQSLFRQAEQELNRLQRRVHADVLKAHAQLTSSIKQAKLLEDAAKKSRRSYDLISKDYRLGMSNNLDVIDAMNSLQSLRRNYDLALLQSKLDFLNLRLAVEMTPENLP